MLFLELTEHRLWAAHQCQPIVDPEVVRGAHALEDSIELTGGRVILVTLVADARARQLFPIQPAGHEQGLLGLRPGDCIRLRHVHRPHEKCAGHRPWMTALAPDAPVQRKLLRHHGIDVDVLRHVIVVLGCIE